MFANGSGSWMTGVRLAQRLGEVDDADRAVGQGSEQVGDDGRGHGDLLGMGQPARKASWSQSAQIDGIDLRVDEQRAVTVARPVGDRREVGDGTDGDALGAGRAGDGGEVGVGEADERHVVAHRREVVDLGAVRGVVVDHDEQAQAEAGGGVELLQREEQRRRRRARRP